jgi:hypothetical protein
MARFDDTYRSDHHLSARATHNTPWREKIVFLKAVRKTYHPLALFDIDLVAKDNLYYQIMVISHHLCALGQAKEERKERKGHTNGKLSGSRGFACIRNSSRQPSSVSKLFELLTSKTSTQQSAPR